MQRGTLHPGPLLTERGFLAEHGCADEPVKAYDRSRVSVRPWQIREWDRYFVFSDCFVFVLTVSRLGWLSLDSVSLADLEKPWQRTWSRPSLWPSGKQDLPASPLAGETLAEGDEYRIVFSVCERQRELYGHLYDFGGRDSPLLFDIVLSRRPGNSIAAAVPFRHRPAAFLYSLGVGGFAAEGRCIYADREYLFSPAASFAVLDWARGAWPRAAWQRASGYGTVAGRRLGFLLSDGPGDPGAAGTSALFCDGAGRRLTGLRFQTRRGSGRGALPKAVGITDSEGRVALEFNPVVGFAEEGGLRRLRAGQPRMAGYFSGTVFPDSGKGLSFDRMTGFFERIAGL